MNSGEEGSGESDRVIVELSPALIYIRERFLRGTCIHTRYAVGITDYVTGIGNSIAHVSGFQSLVHSL